MKIMPTHEERLTQFVHVSTLYPVSCEPLAKGRTDAEWLKGVLAGGAKLVQLRDKISDDRVLYEKALAFRALTKEAGALFIVNNRLDIALAVSADGVHLGNTDLPAEVARHLAPHLIIGVSANTLEQAATAKARGASYFNIGPIFPTSTKEDARTFLGTSVIKQFAAASDLPFTVMGGIKRHHLPELVAHGVRRIAVVTALTEAPDIAAETRLWVTAIEELWRIRKP